MALSGEFSTIEANDKSIWHFELFYSLANDRSCLRQFEKPEVENKSIRRVFVEEIDDTGNFPFGWIFHEPLVKQKTWVFLFNWIVFKNQFESRLKFEVILKDSKL